MDSDSSILGDGVFRNRSQHELARAYETFTGPMRALDEDIQFAQLD